MCLISFFLNNWLFQGASAQVRFQPRLGRFLAAASDKGVSIFDVESDTQIYTLQVKSIRIFAYV